MLQPQRGFLRLLDFAVAQATPPRRCFPPSGRPSSWGAAWWPSAEDSLAQALLQFPPGLKEGRVRPSEEATGHWEDGLAFRNGGVPSSNRAERNSAVDEPWGPPDAVRLGWLNETQLRGFFADLAFEAAKCSAARNLLPVPLMPP